MLKQTFGKKHNSYREGKTWWKGLNKNYQLTSSKPASPSLHTKNPSLKINIWVIVKEIKILAERFRIVLQMFLASVSGKEIKKLEM